VSVELFTSFWTNPLLAEVDAVIVSTSRGRPRWKLPYPYRRMDELAPSDEVWNGGEGWRDLYRRQLDRLGPDAVLGRLERLGDGKPVVALCWEKDPADCHRGVLSRWLNEQTGIEIRELEAGDLPRREGVPQMRLF
jgi:hypothetical protein